MTGLWEEMTQAIVIMWCILFTASISRLAKGPLIAQKFRFLHTVALNKNDDHIVQIDTFRSIHVCHGETKKLKVMCLHSSEG